MARSCLEVVSLFSLSFLSSHFSRPSMHHLAASQRVALHSEPDKAHMPSAPHSPPGNKFRFSYPRLPTTYFALAVLLVVVAAYLIIDVKEQSVNQSMARSCQISHMYECTCSHRFGNLLALQYNKIFTKCLLYNARCEISGWTILVRLRGISIWCIHIPRSFCNIALMKFWMQFAFSRRHLLFQIQIWCRLPISNSLRGPYRYFRVSRTRYSKEDPVY